MHDSHSPRITCCLLTISGPASAACSDSTPCWAHTLSQHSHCLGLLALLAAPSAHKLSVHAVVAAAAAQFCRLHTAAAAADSSAEQVQPPVPTVPWQGAPDAPYLTPPHLTFV
jgi:hypothetical protein